MDNQANLAATELAEVACGFAGYPLSEATDEVNCALQNLKPVAGGYRIDFSDVEVVYSEQAPGLAPSVMESEVGDRYDLIGAVNDLHDVPDEYTFSGLKRRIVVTTPSGNFIGFDIVHRFDDHYADNHILEMRWVPSSAREHILSWLRDLACGALDVAKNQYEAVMELESQRDAA